MALITLKDYALMLGKDPGNIYKKYKNGDFESAHKVGSVILIDEDEPYADKRYKNGKWVDYRKNIKLRKRLENPAKTSGDFGGFEKSGNDADDQLQPRPGRANVKESQ